MNSDRLGEEFPRYPHFRKQEFLCFCFFFAQEISEVYIKAFLIIDCNG